MTEVSVSKLRLYPIKSLDGVDVTTSLVLESGALQYDREIAICDVDGRWVNGKRDSRLNLVRAEYDLERREVRLQSPSTFPEWATFGFSEDLKDLTDWFSDYLGMTVFLQRNCVSGFPDDLHSLGPTIISTATLEELDKWFSINDLEETRRRFRTNIELDARVPFWEDRLFASRNNPPLFRIGEAGFYGSGPCKRCIVPTRHSRTGDTTEEFAKTFASRRKEGLPSWSNKDRFGPLYYRVAINTQPVTTMVPCRISMGDVLALSSDG